MLAKERLTMKEKKKPQHVYEYDHEGEKKNVSTINGLLLKWCSRRWSHGFNI